MLRDFQWVPPSSVCRMVPVYPTAQPDCGVTKVTELRYSVVPLVCGLQLLPPSSVCRMVPLFPTAQPDCGVTKIIEPRSVLVPLFWGLHVCGRPSSAEYKTVMTIKPPATTKANLAHRGNLE